MVFTKFIINLPGLLVIEYGVFFTLCSYRAIDSIQFVMRMIFAKHSLCESKHLIDLREIDSRDIYSECFKAFTKYKFIAFKTSERRLISSNVEYYVETTNLIKFYQQRLLQHILLSYYQTLNVTVESILRL